LQFHTKPVEHPTTQSEYEPFAAAVQSFENEVPERFRPRSSNASYVPPVRNLNGDEVFFDSHHSLPSPLLQPKVELKTTTARSPNITKPAFKPLEPTAEELEEAYIASIPAFKAHPVNPIIMECESGSYGVPNIKPKPPTVPISPSITKVRP